MALLVTPLPDNHARIACLCGDTDKIVSARTPSTVSAEVVRIERRHSCAAV